MKRTFVALIALAGVCGLVTEASAYTCSQNAAACVRKGGNRASCWDPQRMSVCQSTGQYNAPSGKVWPATPDRRRPR